MRFFNGLAAVGNFLQPILLLAIRLFWGIFFAITGYGKFLHAREVSEYFQTLHIPFPLFSTYLTGTFELLGGISLVLGLASRLMSIPLIIITCMAFATAHKDALASLWTDPQVILSQAPFTFLLAALIIFVFGPGLISIDALIKRYKDRGR